MGGEMNDRTPPHSTEAEVAVLGGILLKPQSLDDVADIVLPADFYSPAHGMIYEAMQGIAVKGQAITLVTLAEMLTSQGQLESAGGLAYLSGILDRVVTTAGIEDHARIVADKARVRAVLSACMAIADRGYGDIGDVSEFMSTAESSIYDAAQGRDSSDARSASQIVRETFRWLKELRESGVESFGIGTGIELLDELLCGLQPSAYYILAAATSVGKTTFAVQIAKRCGLPVYLASAEMSQRQVVLRLLSGEAELPVYRILKPQYWGKDGSSRLVDAGRRVDKMPLWIDDTSPMSVQHIWSRARKLKSKQRIGLVIVDYIQILEPPDRKQGRERQIAESSAMLKAMAKDLEVPVLALSQLNRLGATERPQLHHLRDSGSLEQDVDGAIFLHRPEKGKHAPGEEEPTEVILAKNRIVGAIGSVECIFDPVKQEIRQKGASKDPGLCVQDEVADIFDGGDHA